MKLIEIISNTTWPPRALTNEFYLVGFAGEFKLIDSIGNIVDFPGYKVKEGEVYCYSPTDFCFRNGDLYYKIEFPSLKKLRIFSTYKDLWFFNEDYYFEAERIGNSAEFRQILIERKTGKQLWECQDELRMSTLSSKWLICQTVGWWKAALLDIGTGQKIWELDFSDDNLGGDRMVIGNTLVVRKNTRGLMGYDVETGEELWCIPGGNSFHQRHRITNHLVGLLSNGYDYNRYQVVDPKSGTVVANKIFDDFGYDARPNMACMSDTHYYFLSNIQVSKSSRSDERISHLGCLNLATQEIEWMEPLGPTDDRYAEYREVALINNRFYIRDGKKQLHIYEAP